MELRHLPAERSGTVAADGDVLAADVEVAETLGAEMKGLMFRDSVPEDYALVFEFDDPPGWLPDRIAGLRSIHMLFVKVPIDVLWLRDGRVERVSTLSPWTGFGLAKADTIVEMRAGAADDVAVGDEVALVEAATDGHTDDGPDGGAGAGANPTD